jgi:hypothetical protein
MMMTPGAGFPFNVTRPLIEPEAGFESFDW